MPTVLVVEGYRFFFFSNEGNEPPQIHVEKAEGYAKFWFDPVALAYAADFTRPQLRRVRELVAQYEATFVERWEDYFGD